MMQKVLLATTLLLLVLGYIEAGGGHTSHSSGGSSSSRDCSTDVDACDEEGRVCVEGICTQCSTDHTCNAGYVCDEEEKHSKCVPDCRIAGNECQRNGYGCNADGMCRKICSDGDISVCTNKGKTCSNGFCEKCSADVACNSGYVCDEKRKGSECVKDCRIEGNECRKKGYGCNDDGMCRKICSDDNISVCTRKGKTCSNGFCEKCSTDVTCNDGYVCDEERERSKCVKDCRIDGNECDDSRVCDDGVCREDETEGGEGDEP